MYKIYDDFNNFIKCKNLNEVERVLLNYYNKDLIKYTTINNYDVINYKYGHDSYGNPLYMIVIIGNYKTDRHFRTIKTIKSKQSYNIDETIKYLVNKYYA